MALNPFTSRKGTLTRRNRAYALAILACAFVAATGIRATAEERDVGISGKEIVERLSRVEEGQKHLEQRIDNLQKTIEQRFGELREFMLWGFGVTFAGIFALIGFVLWDRRSALAPAVRRIEEVREREQRLESALRDYAARAPDLADALRKSGLL